MGGFGENVATPPVHPARSGGYTCVRSVAVPTAHRPDRPALLDQALALRSLDGATPADGAIPATQSGGTSAERLGIRELRGRLASLVRRAGTGERIVITIAGRPVAQLGPVEAPSSRTTIDDLVARGLLEPARRGDRPADPEVLVDSWTGRRLDRALREVRGA
ncbi:hypothetical protein BH10ACT1_BH10ACT1_31250 [soil metagenome]